MKKDFTALSNVILAVCGNGVVYAWKEEGQLFFLFLKTALPFYEEISVQLSLFLLATEKFCEIVSISSDCCPRYHSSTWVVDVLN